MSDVALFVAALFVAGLFLGCAIMITLAIRDMARSLKIIADKPRLTVHFHATGDVTIAPPDGTKTTLAP